MEVSGKFHDPTNLPPGMSHRYPLNGRLGGPQSRSGLFVEEEHLLSLPVFEVRIVHYTNYVIATINMCTYIHEVEGQYNVWLL